MICDFYMRAVRSRGKLGDLVLLGSCRVLFFPIDSLRPITLAPFPSPSPKNRKEICLIKIYLASLLLNQIFTSPPRSLCLHCFPLFPMHLPRVFLRGFPNLLDASSHSFLTCFSYIPFSLVVVSCSISSISRLRVPRF